MATSTLPLHCKVDALPLLLIGRLRLKVTLIFVSWCRALTSAGSHFPAFSIGLNLLGLSEKEILSYTSSTTKGD